MVVVSHYSLALPHNPRVVTPFAGEIAPFARAVAESTVVLLSTVFHMFANEVVCKEYILDYRGPHGLPRYLVSASEAPARATKSGERDGKRKTRKAQTIWRKCPSTLPKNAF